LISEPEPNALRSCRRDDLHYPPQENLIDGENDRNLADENNDNNVNKEDSLDQELQADVSIKSNPKIINLKLSQRLVGRILLQVEDQGKAWYVNPKNLQRYYLSNSQNAFKIMHELSQGISDQDLLKIPVAVLNNNILNDEDSDNDGLSDRLEKGLGTNWQNSDSDSDGYIDSVEVEKGYNPNGPGAINFDYSFSQKMAGRIFLQVEKHGEAWYINPLDLKRYYLGYPEDAYLLMKTLALGISDKDLNQIEINY